MAEKNGAAEAISMIKTAIQDIGKNYKEVVTAASTKLSKVARIEAEQRKVIRINDVQLTEAQSKAKRYLSYAFATISDEQFNQTTVVNASDVLAKVAARESVSSSEPLSRFTSPTFPSTEGSPEVPAPHTIPLQRDPSAPPPGG